MAPIDAHSSDSNSIAVTELVFLPKAAGVHVIDEEVVKNDAHDEHKRNSDETSTRKEVLYAAGVGLIEDDPELPCLTIRMWVIGIGFCLLGSGVNTLYTFRIPSITLSQSAIQFLAYPVGKAWYLAVPNYEFSVMGQKISTNPGPFNNKVGPPREAHHRVEADGLE